MFTAEHGTEWSYPDRIHPAKPTSFIGMMETISRNNPQISDARERPAVAIRRVAFMSCAAALGYSMAAAAAACGVTYNHLVLVLEGKRRGSAQLEQRIEDMMRAGKPLFMVALAGV